MTTEATPTDYSQMDDAALSAELERLSSADDAAPEAAPDVETPTPAKVEEETPDQADQQEDAAPSTEDGEDDKAIKGRIADVQKQRQRAAAAEQRASELEQRLAAIQQQQQANDLQAKYDRLYDEQGPEAAEQFRLSIVQRQQEQSQQQAQGQRALERIQMSREVAMDLYTDYEAQEAKVIEKYGLEEAQRLAARQSNPAKWAYEEGKSIMTPAERQAAITAEAQKMTDKAVKEALAKLKPPPAGRKTIGDLSSTRTAGVSKAPSEMSDAELASLEADLRNHWSD